MKNIRKVKCVVSGCINDATSVFITMSGHTIYECDKHKSKPGLLTQRAIDNGTIPPPKKI